MAQPARSPNIFDRGREIVKKRKLVERIMRREAILCSASPLTRVDDLLTFGAGAHSTITSRVNARRFCRPNLLSTYASSLSLCIFSVFHLRCTRTYNRMHPASAVIHPPNGFARRSCHIQVSILNVLILSYNTGGGVGWTAIPPYLYFRALLSRKVCLSNNEDIIV
jgi:hypothetical protein